VSRRAARICSAPGCPELVQGASRCPAHLVTQDQRRDKDPAQRKFYSSARWKALSKFVRQQEPTCRICSAAQSQQVDHKDGNWRNNSRENLQAICKPCHLAKSGAEHRGGRASK
jgi:5-methylcytosine-specific restriction endonuclease McrA